MSSSLLGTLTRFADLPDRYRAQAPTLFAAGLLLYLLSAGLHYVLISMESARERERKDSELEILAREAELHALKARIQPHFLYNSLNAIGGLISGNPDGARRMCVELAEFLRRSLSAGERSSIRVGEELELVRHYLDVERIRFGERLTVEEEIEPGGSECLVPPLLLQPLVENAVVHGISTLIEGGTVRLEARRAGNRLRIVIENPFDPDAPARPRGGLGLRLVRERLAALYGADAIFAAKRLDGRHLAIISVPARVGRSLVTEPVRVLVVDDEEPARTLLAEILSRAPGVRVVGECRNGFEAVRAAAEERPDAVFLDIEMPKLDGLEVAELLDPAIAVVFVTAYDQYAVQAFDAEAVDYVLKPYRPERLLEALSRARARGRPAGRPLPARRDAAARRELPNPARRPRRRRRPRPSGLPRSTTSKRATTRSSCAPKERAIGWRRRCRPSPTRSTRCGFCECTARTS